MYLWFVTLDSWIYIQLRPYCYNLTLWMWKLPLGIDQIPA